MVDPKIGVEAKFKQIELEAQKEISKRTEQLYRKGWKGGSTYFKGLEPIYLDAIKKKIEVLKSRGLSLGDTKYHLEELKKPYTNMIIENFTRSGGDPDSSVLKNELARANATVGALIGSLAYDVEDWGQQQPLSQPSPVHIKAENIGAVHTGIGDQHIEGGIANKRNGALPKKGLTLKIIGLATTVIALAAGIVGLIKSCAG